MAKKKSLITDNDNPALAFISRESKTAVDREETQKAQSGSTSLKAPEGYRVNPLYIETRTKRVQLVWQPSLFEKVKAASEAEGISINEYVHRVLRAAVGED